MFRDHYPVISRIDQKYANTISHPIRFKLDLLLGAVCLQKYIKLELMQSVLQLKLSLLNIDDIIHQIKR